MEDTAGEVVAVAQRRLKSRRAERPFERSVLEVAIDQAADFLEVTGMFDRDSAIAELETREAITIGRATKLVDEVGHVPWYFGDRQRPGPFFRRYRDYLLDYQSWGDTAVDAMADTTDEIMEQLEDPHRPGPWDRRGLVVGHVQSGKTANYAGLMCKAGDTGYRLIIVLAGMHNALRKQTQQRLDRDFLGFSTLPVPDGTPRETIGAGLINPSVHADFITNQAINGDFNRTRVESQGTGPGEHPLLMVVKKNASVLRNLNTWVKDFLERRGDTRTVPLLVIDDEADQASVDTGDQDFDGDVPDPNYEPTRINGQIRALLDAFDRSAYVAYTATPFANILIHDERVADKFGADLFPKSFIVNLAAPSTYIGPADLFGVNGDPGAEPPPPPLPLTRKVDQVKEGWIEAPHKSDFIPLTDGERRIPRSLEDAILSFVLACAARRARGNPTAHNSMLVHVSRFKAVQLIVHGEIDTWFKDVTRQLIYRAGADALLDRLRALWEDDFVPTTASVAETKYGRNLTPLSWAEVDTHLTAAAESITPRLVNSEIKEPLDYDAAKDHGLNVIAIGGDKLSRGLTLEGLTVSYFLRQSTAYDSLMQMGRWFGYRPGYTDLCRLYTTSDMTAWFRHVATAAEELREQLDHMAALGATPKDYGLKIQSHDHLLVTASNKMRYAEEVQVTFAGEGKNQTVFSTVQRVIDHNAVAIANLLSEAGEPADVGRSGDRTWRGVDGNLVAACLAGMNFPPESYNVNGLRLSQYIRAQLEHAELTDWTIALRAGDGPKLDLGPFSVKTVKRAPVDDRTRDERHIIQTALSPRDESIDLDDDQFRAALALTNTKRQKKGLAETDIPGGTEIRRIRGLGDDQTGLSAHPERGLLLIYPLSPREAGLTSNTPIVALVVSFPASKTARPITYRYNTVLSRMEMASQ